MPTGIIIEWPGSIEYRSTEYIDAIDLDNLAELKPFRQTKEWWPQSKKFVCYNVECKIKGDQNLRRVIVKYKHENNQNNKDFREDPVCWGRNEIIITPGKDCGICNWQPEEGNPGEVKWKRKKLREERDHRRSPQQIRDDKFRPQILDLDNKRCVITGETAIEALDAAHIIPAAEDGNEIPENGIALRADIHRLYDAGKFVINPETGRPERIASDLSKKYRKILKGGQLLEQTRKRVGDALCERWPG